MSSLAKVHRHGWIIPAVVAIAAGIGGVASNLVATDLETTVGPYRWVVWSVFALSGVIAVAAALRESKATRPPRTNFTTTDRSVNVEGDVSGIVTTGDSNTVVNASNYRPRKPTDDDL